MSPTQILQYEDITLSLESVSPAVYKKQFVPSENFIILNREKTVGSLRFRIGQSKHLLFYAGQIGYEIGEAYRGNRYATKALKAVLPHCFMYFPEIFITCNTDNHASIKTIESIPHIYLGVVKIPKSNMMYREGERAKRRYCLTNTAL